MNNNVNTSKLTTMLKSKGFITGLCGVLAVLVLVIGYNMRVNQATSPIKVPVASHKLKARTKITDDDITYITMPRSALGNDYYSNKNSIVGMYVNIDTAIPAGSLFYAGAIVRGEDLPDAALLDVPDGETLYYITVNMLTSYTNSILPGRYIDIYLSTKENNLALVGKLFTNVKVLQVKTTDGQNVFDDADTQKVPYAIYFSLPEEDHLLMRKINAINNYSIAQAGSSFARIEVIPVPTTAYFKDDDKEAKVEVSSKYLKDYVLNLAAEIEEQTDIIIDQNTNDPNTIDDENINQ